MRTASHKISSRTDKKISRMIDKKISRMTDKKISRMTDTTANAELTYRSDRLLVIMVPLVKRWRLHLSVPLTSAGPIKSNSVFIFYCESIKMSKYH